MDACAVFQAGGRGNGNMDRSVQKIKEYDGRLRKSRELPTRAMCEWVHHLTLSESHPNAVPLEQRDARATRGLLQFRSLTVPDCIGDGWGTNFGLKILLPSTGPRADTPY